MVLLKMYTISTNVQLQQPKEFLYNVQLMIFVYILIGLSAKSHHHDAAASSSYTAIRMM